jgi:hypothetical protein
MTPDLATTNMLLGIMAAVSVLEVLAIAGLFAGGVLLYRRLMRTIADIESKHVAPASVRINAILDDVRSVTSVVKGAAARDDGQARSGFGWVLRRFRSGGRAA